MIFSATSANIITHDEIYNICLINMLMESHKWWSVQLYVRFHI